MFPSIVDLQTWMTVFMVQSHREIRVGLFFLGELRAMFFSNDLGNGFFDDATTRTEVGANGQQGNQAVVVFEILIRARQFAELASLINSKRKTSLCVCESNECQIKATYSLRSSPQRNQNVP
jgi:hypothetical protein